MSRIQQRFAHSFFSFRYTLVLVALPILVTDFAYAQTSRVGTGQVISVREFPLKPGVNEVEFEKFVFERFNPALEGAVPGAVGFVTKADRGIGTGRYAYVVIYDTKNTRDAMMPRPGVVAEWFEQFYEPIKPVFEELWEYADRSVWAEYTDYVVLR